MKKVNFFILLLAALILNFVAAMFSTFASTSASPSPTTAKSKASMTANLSWQATWNKRVTEAKKEGSVVGIFSAGPRVRNSLINAFSKKFGIKLEITSGRSGELVEKIGRERRAGLYTTDIIGAGATTQLENFKPQGFLTPLPLILPEITDPKVWQGGRLPFFDKEGMIIAPIALYYKAVLINKNLIKKDQMKSHFDLLNPEWKGKIILHDPTVSGASGVWLSHIARMFNYDLNKFKEYLSNLAKQKPFITRDTRLEIEWVARGKYAILIGTSYSTVPELIKMGAPVAIAPMEEGTYVSTVTGALSIASGEIPHPNAAFVFINWILSKEGQTAYVEGYGSPSLRLDVSTADIDPIYLAIPGEKLVYEDEYDVINRIKLRAIAKEVLAPLMK